MQLVIERMGVVREKDATVKITHFCLAVGNKRSYILMF